MDIDKQNQYSQMQRKYYDEEASAWYSGNMNPVIGNYKAHLEYDDFSDLFANVDNISTKTVLDFGCGPGRNLVRFRDRVGRIDGIDISPVCIERAKINLDIHKLDPSAHTFYVTNGIDLSDVSSASYDVVMSVITLQHICVYTIRYALLHDMYRVLKAGGTLTAQMGFGERLGAQEYYVDHYNAERTNGWEDVMVTNPDQLRIDLEHIGYKNFQYHFTPCRGGDAHEQWIYFSAHK